MRVKDEKLELIDAPGTYSLEPSNKAEDVAVQMLNDADVVINVIDSTNLERNLFLTLELLEKGVPVIVALNLWDEAQHLGISINEKQLEELLGVPVIPTVALTGEGIKELVAAIEKVMPSKKIEPMGEEERWIKIGFIVKKVERLSHRHHSLRDKIADMTIKPLTGIPVAMIVIFCAFWVVRFIGETLIVNLFEPFFEGIYRPFAGRPEFPDGGFYPEQGRLHEEKSG